MFLEIVSPEATLFSESVDSVSVPGIDGNFQMLENHAAIVSVLQEGIVKIHVHTKEHLEFNQLNGNFETHKNDNKILTLKITSGTVEMKDNKVVILVD
jgi:F-type H+-transporting ATPase subunit epsilon